MLQDEIEFEWIRQFYSAGGDAHAMLGWWKVPMERIMNAWRELENRTASALKTLEQAACYDTVTDAMWETLDKEAKKTSKKLKKAFLLVESSEVQGVIG